MSLTTEDVKIIKNLLRDEIRPVRSDVSSLKTDVSELKTDVSSLKSDVSELKTDLSVLKSDFTKFDKRLINTEQCIFDLADMLTVVKGEVIETKADIKNIKSEVSKLTALQEAQTDKIQILFEVTTDTRERLVSFNKYNDRLRELELNYSIVSLTSQTNTRAIKELQKEIKK